MLCARPGVPPSLPPGHTLLLQGAPPLSRLQLAIPVLRPLGTSCLPTPQLYHKHHGHHLHTKPSCRVKGGPSSHPPPSPLQLPAITVGRPLGPSRAAARVPVVPPLVGDREGWCVLQVESSGAEGLTPQSKVTTTFGNLGNLTNKMMSVSGTPSALAARCSLQPCPSSQWSS